VEHTVLPQTSHLDLRGLVLMVDREEMGGGREGRGREGRETCPKVTADSLISVPYQLPMFSQ